MSRKTRFALAGAIGFGLGGAMLLFIFDAFDSANEPYGPVGHVVIKWLFLALHPFMGAIGGGALMGLIAAGAAEESKAHPDGE